MKKGSRNEAKTASAASDAKEDQEENGLRASTGNLVEDGEAEIDNVQPTGAGSQCQKSAPDESSGEEGEGFYSPCGTLARNSGQPVFSFRDETGVCDEDTESSDSDTSSFSSSTEGEYDIDYVEAVGGIEPGIDKVWNYVIFTFNFISSADVCIHATP